MRMKLVLAEKPSVAQSLARVLGADKRCNGYVVSWCVGHLVEVSGEGIMEIDAYLLGISEE